MGDPLPRSLVTYVVFKAMNNAEGKEMGVPVASRPVKRDADDIAAYLNYLIDQSVYYEFLLATQAKEGVLGGLKALKDYNTNERMDQFMEIKRTHNVPCLYRVKEWELTDPKDIQTIMEQRQQKE